MAEQSIKTVVGYNSINSIIVHDDGSLKEPDRHRLCNLSEKVKILTREEADDRVSPTLTKYPKCLAFRNSNVYGLKLFDIALLANEWLNYFDTDVLFFDDPALIYNREDAIDLVGMRDFISGVAIEKKNLRFVAPLASRFNAGLMQVKREAYDLEYIEFILGSQFNQRQEWIEQTCWSALAMRVNSALWDFRRVCMGNSKHVASKSTVAAHFASWQGRERFDSFAANTSGTNRVGSTKNVLANPIKRLTYTQYCLENAKRRVRRWQRKLRKRFAAHPLLDPALLVDR